jgi:hypothetical protein
MVCFEVETNGVRFARGGLPGTAVLAAHVTWVLRRGEKPPGEMFLTLGGLDTSTEPAEHVGWGRQDLKVGDVVTLRVVEADTADPVKRRFKEGGRSPERKSMLKAELQAVEKRRQQLLKDLQAASPRTRASGGRRRSGPSLRRRTT